MKLKKILASILCVAMVLSTMSFAVFAEETNAVAKVGETYYSTLTEAMGKFNGRTVEVLCDIEEDIEGFWGVTLMTNVEGGVTITNTNTDWVDFDDVTVGAGVTVDIELPFSGDSENVILGTLVAGDTYYHGYDATTTIKDGGKVVVEGTTILRYNKNADSGIYIYGDSDDSTVEFDCGYYIGAYSGTFYVENANVEAGYVLFKNSYDADQNKGYADAAMMLDNSSITVAGTDDEQNSFQIDANTTLAMTNGSSIENVRDFNLLAGANLDLSMDASSTIAATNVSVAEDVPFDAVGNGDGTWSLVRVIAKIGDKKYETLTEALADATNGDTIVLYSNLDELATLVNSGNTFKGLTVQLGSDIDLNNEEWTPIGNSTYSFQGTFDGDGHTISNLLVTGNKSNVGLFGYTTVGEIKNLIVENASVSGRLNVGVVAGTPYTSKYTNITVKGHVEVNGMAYVGAVGGKNAYANWTDITVDVDDTSYVYADSVEGGTAYRTYVGGVIGFMGEGNHTVKNVTSNIDVTGTVCDIGGIVGIAHYGNTFENVTCSGSVTNTNTNEEDLAETGAIAGVWHNQAGQTVTFIDCTYTGNSNVALVGAAYNASNTTEGTSGSLIIDGNTSWPSEARIGMTGYATLKEAVAAAESGDVITLINDVVLDEVITIQESIVIDGAGHTISQAEECVNEYALLYFDGADVLDITVKNVTFDGVKGGAAVRTLGANMTIDNCVFQNCEHTQKQGLVRLTQGSATITNSKFLNNTCSMVVSFNYDTAGLEGDTFIVDDCEFENNTANSTAVVYYVKGEGCEIKNTEFVGNTVNCNTNGATIYLGFQENCSVTGCLFENNVVKDASTSTRVAGGIFFGYEAEIANNVFKNNSAENANGKDGIGQSVCTSTYYECDIDLSENYFNGGAPVEGVDYLIQHKTGDGEFVLNNYYESYTTDSEGNIVLDGRVDVNDVVATNGEGYYYSLQDAVDAAEAGDIITVQEDIAEKVVIAAPAVATLAANDEAIVIDLNGKTLNGYILIEDANKNIEIKNGNIVNEDSAESAIESVGTLTVTDVNITSARHAINVEGGNAEINGGNFALIQKDVLTQNVIGAENAVVIINDGVFTGPAGTTADSGAAVAAKTGSTVEIYGGKFSGGKLNTLSAKGTLVVYGGMFDQDPAAYIAETSEAVDMGAYTYPYGVAPKAAGKINVALEATDNKNVYNIVLTSADEYDINEFVSAELTFKNESVTVGKSVMDYKISGYADNKTFAQEAKDAIGLGENEEQYIISLNDGAERLSTDKENDVTKIIIGQVEFFGQGDIKFSVTKGEVDTTWQNTNLGRYYTTEIAAPAEATLGIENAAIDSNVPEVHRDVAVNVAFNHNIDTAKYWGNYQITATIKNSAMNYTETKDITIADIKSGACVFEDVPVGYITVTLKAPGFRTYTHNTTLEETKDNGVLVLNFWNDVKKNDDEVIETGKDKMDHNFLVGDIVMDMKVDKYDLAAVTSYYGTYGIDTAEAEKYIKYDLNRDGDIDIRDVQYVLHTMGN